MARRGTARPGGRGMVGLGLSGFVTARRSWHGAARSGEARLGMARRSTHIQQGAVLRGRPYSFTGDEWQKKLNS